MLWQLFAPARVGSVVELSPELPESGVVRLLQSSGAAPECGRRARLCQLLGPLYKKARRYTCENCDKVDVADDSNKRERKTRKRSYEITYPAMVGAFLPFRTTVLFGNFVGLLESGSKAVDAPVPEAATAARLRCFLLWTAGLAEPDGSG